MEEPEVLSDERFAELFGFCPVRHTKEQKEKAREVNLLLDAVSDELSIPDRYFFEITRREEEYTQFLSRVINCPEDIIRRAQHMLKPDSPERRSLALIQAFRKGKR